VWFKACRPVQAFEPRLTAAVAQRWPDRVAEVLAWDEQRAWLLSADAGQPIGDIGNPPERWLEALPRYAELQRGESRHVDDHLANGVPDLRTASLPQRFDELVASDLPLGRAEVEMLRREAPRFTELAAELAAGPIDDSIEHADLHLRSVFIRNDRLRVLDWGDASIAHPFFSLVVTFQSLRETNGLLPGDPWFARLRDAYLEPWGSGLVPLFDLAFRVGTVAHAFTWLRHRDAMGGGVFPLFDARFPDVLRQARDAIRAVP
jgi:hypothetical protein